MASVLKNIEDALKIIVIAAGIAETVIGGQQHTTKDKFPTAEIFLKPGKLDDGAFLVADKEFRLKIRIVHDTTNLVDSLADVVSIALLNQAGRQALFAAGVNNITPSNEWSPEDTGAARSKYRHEINFKIETRLVIGS